MRIKGIATGLFVFLLIFGIIHNAKGEDIYIFSGAGLRQPVDKLVQGYQEKTGHRIFVDYAGSGQHLTKINASARGDIIIPGALFYIEKLQAAGKIKSYRPIVYHTPVIGVNIKQASRVTCFKDLAAPGIRLAMGDPKAMALGRTALSICERAGLKEEVLKNVVVYGATVKQLSLYVSQGVVDAAVIGRADAVQNSETISMVTIPKDWFEPEVIAAAVLQSAPDPDLAQDICDYLGSEHAVNVFKNYGFLPIEK